MNGTDSPDLLSLLHAAHAAQAEVEAGLEALGLSLTKLLTLEALAAAGDALPLGQLADRLACVKSNVTQLVDRLETDGLVVRRLDPRDRRTRLAVLTAAGQRAWQEGSAVRRNIERQILGRLSQVEAQQFGALLAKLGPAIPESSQQ